MQFKNMHITEHGSIIFSIIEEFSKRLLGISSVNPKGGALSGRQIEVRERV